MDSDHSTEASLWTRAKNWFEGIPFASRAVFVVCVGVFLWQLLSGWTLAGSVCLQASAVVERHQIYRLFTHPFFHLGVLHVFLNMMAFVPIGSRLERQMGTVKFLYVMGMIVLLGDLCYILMAYLFSTAGTPGFVNRCGLGFSGVIFGLIVIHAHQSHVESYSILGLFPVPAKLYAWALLVFWQLLIPGLSFLGHLSGVLIGQAYVWKWLTPAMPSDALVQKAEQTLCAGIRHLSSFILLTNASVELPTYTQASGNTRSSWLSAFRRLAGNSDAAIQGSGTSGGDAADGRFPGQPRYIREPPASSSDVIPVVVEPQDDFDRLVEMGFEESSVRAALLASDGDFTTAMNKLTGAS